MAGEKVRPAMPPSPRFRLAPRAPLLLLCALATSLPTPRPFVAEAAAAGADAAGAAAARSERGVEEYHELWYEQRLDHFKVLPDNRWRHRYLLGNASWDGRGRLANGCQGPILLYAGNEGDIEGFWASNGFLREVLAPELGGLLVFPEQRFYGKSRPFGASPSSEELSYLTTSQVLEDYVELLAHLKSTLPGASRCPVIAFGGSYGGTLAALLRASRPAVIAGALAASSELGYYDIDGWAAHGVTAFAFEDIVVKDYAEAESRCLDSIRAAVEALEASSEEAAVRALGACDARALGPSRSSLLVYALEALPQQDYPYQIGAMPPSPVRAACAALVRGLDGGRAGLLAATGEVARMALSISDGACIPDLGPGGPGNTPGDGPGPDSWGWQSCTETLHAFSAQVLRNFTFDLGASAAQCRAIYGAGLPSPDLAALARRFGGYALAEGTAGVTRLIWSQGTLDPWSGWFQRLAKPPPGSDVHHLVMEGSAHHLDLRAPHPSDPPAVAAGRRFEAEVIRRWIAEASGGPALPGEATSTLVI